MFKEFMSADGMSLILPSNIISGKITDISYRTNPIRITINTGKKIFNATFPDHFMYNKIVGRQKPEIGKKIYVSLDHNNNIKNITIT